MTESLMRREAAEAPEAVARQLAGNATLCRDIAHRLKARPPRFVATCARGSSDNAATFAKYLIEIRRGVVVASIGPSISSVYGTRPKLQEGLFVAISQSGRSPDLLSLADAARADGAFTLALVNDAASPLAMLSDMVVPLHAGPERSVAATKSFITALSALLQVFAFWMEDEALLRLLDGLPEQLARAAALDWSAAEEPLGRADNLFVAGRGPSYAVAQEAALKFKETSGIHAEAYSAAELMHGPQALAGPRFPAFILSQQDEALPGMRGLAEQFLARGVPVVAAGPAAVPGAVALPTLEGIDPFLAPLALIQSFYPLIDRIAALRGRDPDQPPHLKKVTETL